MNRFHFFLLLLGAGISCGMQASAQDGAEIVPPIVEEAASLPAENVEGSVDPKSGFDPMVMLVSSITIFVLAVFVGFEVITKVPTTLHTPLMSGSNAISGIAVVGAILTSMSFVFSSWIGMLAVALAAVNVVGGFMVTHRMLSMFRARK